MRHEGFWLTAGDATELFINRWCGDAPLKGVVMISHGMAEHSLRYARFAEALTAQGFQVYALDQRGHGKTAERGTVGHYADNDGWQKVVSDLALLNHHIRSTHPQAPIFLFAHSMGSYIAQAYLMQHSCSLQGAVLSGSNYGDPLTFKAGRLIAQFERWRQGNTGRSKLLDFLSFGSFNKAFKPNRTAFDWLSRDPSEVDKYVNDPLCGFLCSNQLWVDLLGGLVTITSVPALSTIDADLPVLVIGGERDPVSDGKRLSTLAEKLREAGLNSVQLNIYPQARHELLNETNRADVTHEVINWLEAHLTHARVCTPKEMA
ncbi:alpha/beta hydrolase [Atopomonas sediminilitoris]|uniref:alpha/beta hydrolase n=1 Tax=Atopomonas sediminilitoris TaxID=2919919 RepID=UPI001F4DF85B|nr:alpha/beta hydrolase [Atopomonas sediminilitoris]MCJ8169806.1 alpha/beta hydrolase [Atopomonas sediminilitoris]